MLTTLFYHTDEFCKVFEKEMHGNGWRERKKGSELILSEIMTICIYYHCSGYKTFKDYYKKEVLVNMQTAFKGLVSYNRFIELKKMTVLPMALFLKLNMGSCTGVSFIDSFAVKVCHNRRIYSHKVFKGTAQRGKTSVDWFYGFKVHFVINHVGEIVDFYITPGNVADNNTEVLNRITQDICGKLIGDKGYIVKPEFYEQLYQKGIQLITKIKKGMKNKLMDTADKLLLRKRGTIESCIGILKEVFSIEHSRHRSPTNFLSHLFSALVAYCFRPNKPSILGSRRCLAS
jgi:hypothetical protein